MTTKQQDDANSQPGEVRSSAPLGLPPLPQCYMRHWINCPFEDIGLFKEEQMRAYAEQAVAAERERWGALRSWVERARMEHESGQMMSIAESIHGAASLRDVLNQMNALERPNVSSTTPR